MSEIKPRAPQLLSDDELTAELGRLAASERSATVSLISHLAEFDLRRLYRGAGFSSLFGYCTGALRFSESSAYHRIKAARAARKFPVVLELLGTGVVNLTSVRLLAPHLTRENHRDLLDEAAGKSRLQVEEMLAQRFPHAPVPDSIRRLPAPAIATAAAPLLENQSPERAPTVGAATPIPSGSGTVAPLSALSPPSHRPAVAPLSSDQYKVTFTASAETWRKLRQARELMRHQVPDGDLAEIFDRALGLLLEQLARRKFAAVNGARSAGETRASRGALSERGAASDAPPAASRHIPAEVRRAVWSRDGGSCAFVAGDGRRCGQRGFVEFHHVRPFAVGGPPTAANIALRCRSHNGHEAELYFGPSRAAALQPP
jgi:hypothetical protein